MSPAAQEPTREPLTRMSPLVPVDGGAEFAVDLTGFSGPQRAHVLGVIALVCTEAGFGVLIRPRPPETPNPGVPADGPDA